MSSDAEAVFRRFKRWLLSEPEGDEPDRHIPKRQVERYREYEYLPLERAEEHRDHKTFWTRAPGVWFCRTCSEWYRTWEGSPRRHPDQSDRVRWV